MNNINLFLELFKNDNSKIDQNKLYNLLIKEFSIEIIKDSFEEIIDIEPELIEFNLESLFSRCRYTYLKKYLLNTNFDYFTKDLIDNESDEFYDFLEICADNFGFEENNLISSNLYLDTTNLKKININFIKVIFNILKYELNFFNYELKKCINE